MFWVCWVMFGVAFSVCLRFSFGAFECLNACFVCVCVFGAYWL